MAATIIPFVPAQRESTVTAPVSKSAVINLAAARRIRDELTRPQEVIGELHLLNGPTVAQQLRAYGRMTTPSQLAELVMEVACIANRMAEILPESMAPIQDALADALVLAEELRDGFADVA